MGVFLFGIVLNPSRQGQILAERLTTVGNGLFIPIFFAHIGLTADIKLVSQAGLLTLVFVSVAIAGKVIGCALGAKPWFSLKDSLRIGVGMIPRAEVALLMASIGLKSKIISPRIFAVVVVMVFITNLLSPVVIRLAFLGRKGNGANERAEESHGVQEG
jgi:Kef-type K+ transport system membrane component KefB